MHVRCPSLTCVQQCEWNVFTNRRRRQKSRPRWWAHAQASCHWNSRPRCQRPGLGAEQVLVHTWVDGTIARACVIKIQRPHAQQQPERRLNMRSNFDAGRGKSLQAVAVRALARLDVRLHVQHLGAARNSFPRVSPHRGFDELLRVHDAGSRDASVGLFPSTFHRLCIWIRRVVYIYVCEDALPHPRGCRQH